MSEELTDKDWIEAVHSGHKLAEKHLIMPLLLGKMKFDKEAMIQDINV